MTSIKFEEKGHMAELTASLTSEGVEIEIDRPWAGDGRGENCSFDLSPEEAKALGEFLIKHASVAQDAATVSLFDLSMDAQNDGRKVPQMGAKPTDK